MRDTSDLQIQRLCSCPRYSITCMARWIVVIAELFLITSLSVLLVQCEHSMNETRTTLNQFHLRVSKLWLFFWVFMRHHQKQIDNEDKGNV